VIGNASTLRWVNAWRLVGRVGIEVQPETERLVRKELEEGHFRSVDEIIVQGVQAWRDKHGHGGGKPRKRLYELLTEAPFAGSGLKIERDRDSPERGDLS
jgi:Arc/MetJ-type ribon-helix-helix transcriptional regulator